MAEIKSCMAEVFSGVFRLSTEENAQHGDRFVRGIPFRFVSHDVIELVAVSSDDGERLPPSSWRPLMNACHALGASTVAFTRTRKDGTKQKRFVRVRHVEDRPEASDSGVVPIRVWCVWCVRRLLSVFRLVRFPARLYARPGRSVPTMGSE